MKIVQENTIVITAADIYFNVSGVEEANNWKNKYTHSFATLVEIRNTPTAQDDQIHGAVEEVKRLLREVIERIKKDQKTIATKIKKIIESDKMG